jgi:glycosyltransferase involved in cell wall biosynthesis
VTILSFADTRFPIERANGVQTMHTCHALAARGHRVHLLVRADTTTPARDPFLFYGLAPVPDLAIDAVSATGNAPIRRAQMLWAGVRRALSGSFDVVFTRDLGLAALLVRLPASRRPGLVYESHGVAAVVSREMPLLLGRADLAPNRAKLQRLVRRDRRVWRDADAYVTITRALADDLAGQFGPRTHMHVVPDGAVLSPAEPPGTTGGPLRVAYAGHLYPWKGIDVLLRALSLTPDAEGLIVGGHPGEPDLARVRALIETLGLTARVTITGLLPPHDVAATLNDADVLVLPNTPSTISDRYTSPLKLFEYLTRARAIVASDLPSIREILTHDQTALLVPAGDSEALAGALTRLAADRALRDRLGAAARALAPEYSWAKRAERLEPALAAAVRR